jgi:hypothetical protein
MAYKKYSKPKMPAPAKRRKTSSWIKYQDSIIIFLDILGFRGTVEKSYSGKKLNKNILAEIYDGIQTIRTTLRIDDFELDREKHYFN